MHTHLERRVIVIRVWQEVSAQTADNSPLLRGTLQEVRSQTVYPFSSFQELMVILHRSLPGLSSLAADGCG